MLQTFFEACLDLLFPKSEVVRALEKMSADEFLAQVGAISPEEEATLHAKDTIALFSYKSEYAREAIHQLKYNKNGHIAAMLGEILERKLQVLTAEEQWLVIPAPLHRKKYRARGYNQIRFLLKMMPGKSTVRNWHIEKKILVKLIHTTAQSKLEGRAERLTNISSVCFHVNAPKKIATQNIILVDDVYTTGTTMEAMKRALILEGAKRVVCVALTH